MPKDEDDVFTPSLIAGSVGTTTALVPLTLPLPSDPRTADHVNSHVGKGEQNALYYTAVEDLKRLGSSARKTQRLTITSAVSVFRLCQHIQENSNFRSFLEDHDVDVGSNTDPDVGSIVRFLRDKVFKREEHRSLASHLTKAIQYAFDQDWSEEKFEQALKKHGGVLRIANYAREADGGPSINTSVLNLKMNVLTAVVANRSSNPKPAAEWYIERRTVLTDGDNLLELEAMKSTDRQSEIALRRWLSRRRDET